MNRRQVESRIESGVMTWVDRGKIARECTYMEVLQFRRHRQELESGLPTAEVPGCVYRPPAKERNRATQYERRSLVGQAYEFYRANAYA